MSSDVTSITQSSAPALDAPRSRRSRVPAHLPTFP